MYDDSLLTQECRDISDYFTREKNSWFWEQQTSQLFVLWTLIRKFNHFCPSFSTPSEKMLPISILIAPLSFLVIYSEYSTTLQIKWWCSIHTAGSILSVFFCTQYTWFNTRLLSNIFDAIFILIQYNGSVMLESGSWMQCLVGTIQLVPTLPPFTVLCDYTGGKPRTKPKKTISKP